MAQNEMKRYKAKIAGKTYTIIGKESHYHMDIVNDLVNEQMDAIKEKAPILTNEQAAVLLATNTLSIQVKQQEVILKQRKEIDSLKEELYRLKDLEKRLNKIENREKELRKSIADEKRAATEEERLNNIEVQKVLNQQVKEKIRRNNDQKKEVTQK